MEPPRVRIGWLTMLLRVFRSTGGEALYGEMIAITERLLADAEREAREEEGRRDVRQRP